MWQWNELYLFHVQSTDYAQAVAAHTQHKHSLARQGCQRERGRHAYWSSAFAGLQDSRLFPHLSASSLRLVILFVDRTRLRLPHLRRTRLDCKLEPQPKRNRDDVTASTSHAERSSNKTVDIDSAAALLWERLTSPIHRLGEAHLTATSLLSVTRPL